MDTKAAFEKAFQEVYPVPENAHRLSTQNLMREDYKKLGWLMWQASRDDYKKYLEDIGTSHGIRIKGKTE